MLDITNIRNKEVSLWTSLSWIALLSLIVCLLSKWVENTFPFYKKYCEENVLCPTYPILLVRFTHYYFTFLFCLYYFLFNTQYDFYYLTLYSLLILHWLITNDCLLSVWEMSYYTKQQEWGETPLLHPHYRVFAGDFTDFVILIQALLMTLSFVLVIRRNRSTYYCSTYYPFLFGAVILFLQAYLMLKDRIPFFWK